MQFGSRKRAISTIKYLQLGCKEQGTLLRDTGAKEYPKLCTNAGEKLSQGLVPLNQKVIPLCIKGLQLIFLIAKSVTIQNRSMKPLHR